MSPAIYAISEMLLKTISDGGVTFRNSTSSCLCAEMKSVTVMCEFRDMHRSRLLYNGHSVICTQSSYQNLINRQRCQKHMGISKTPCCFSHSLQTWDDYLITKQKTNIYLLCACRPFDANALFFRKLMGMTSFAFLRLIAFLHAGQLPLPRSLFFSDAIRARVKHS